MLELLSQLKSHNIISELNYQFAKLIDSKQQGLGYSQQQDLAVLLAALVSFSVMQGNTAVRLDSSFAKDPFDLKKTAAYWSAEYWLDKENNQSELYQQLSQQLQQKIGDALPSEWAAILAEHIAFSADPNKVAPMLFHNGYLYFYRYWSSEKRIASYLQQAVTSPQKVANWDIDAEILRTLFPEDEKVNWQKMAVATALARQFCVISGGPGTGKTYTVARVLAALQLKQEKLGLPPLKVALAAPTGKAASRMKESIAKSVVELKEKVVEFSGSNKFIDEMDYPASTLHSLIGIRPFKDEPKFNQKNPLNIDLLIVDEASMLDIFLTEKLLNALKPTTRLILLGDKDQLASVEAGGIMGDFGKLLATGYTSSHCEILQQMTGYLLERGSQSDKPMLVDSLCHLKESRRFNAEAGIGKLATLVNQQQVKESWQFLEQPHDDVELFCYPPISSFTDKTSWEKHCLEMVKSKAVELYRDYLDLVKKRVKDPACVSVQKIFLAFQKVRFLTPLRKSVLGVEILNEIIALALQQAHLVAFSHVRENYLGKPILVTENSPQLNIFNGDIGLVLPDKDGEYKVYFESAEAEKYLKISPHRLPEYEPAYVMTVHKSQGSEFAHTLLVMPLQFAPVITKELIYTAITRSSQKFSLFSDKSIWQKGVKEVVDRQSGLFSQIKLQNI